MSENVLVLGLGEVGKSIEQLYYESNKDFRVGYKDLDVSWIPFKTTDVLHVCIPYSDSFEDSVVKAIQDYNPKLVIINSTVDVGVSRKISEEVSVDVAHSPVMGKHPDLTESIKTFKKIVGGVTERATELACQHFESVGVDTIPFNNSEEAELSKLYSTSYYGTLIAFMQNVHQSCEHLNLDFNNVYKKANEVYNDGYVKMNMEKFKRPVLDFMGYGIGGHCIVENAQILADVDNSGFDSARIEITEPILLRGKPE